MARPLDRSGLRDAARRRRIVDRGAGGIDSARSDDRVAAARQRADAGSGNTLLEFATGWDDNVRDHGRPAPVTFAPDGSMFLGNDNDGNIVWIAPFALARN